MVKYPSVPKVPKAMGSGGASLLFVFFVFFETPLRGCLPETGVPLENETLSGLETTSAMLLSVKLVPVVRLFAAKLPAAMALSIT